LKVYVAAHEIQIFQYRAPRKKQVSELVVQIHMTKMQPSEAARACSHMRKRERR
jgi:hypothetical protein